MEIKNELFLNYIIFVKELKTRETMKINSTKILITEIPDEAKSTASGIIIPNAVMKKDCLKGKVVLVGQGTADVTMVYQEGDTVVYHPRAGVKFNYDDKEYRLIDISDVFLGGV